MRSNPGQYVTGQPVEDQRTYAPTFGANPFQPVDQTQLPLVDHPEVMAPEPAGAQFVQTVMPDLTTSQPIFGTEMKSPFDGGFNKAAPLVITPNPI